MKLSEYIKDKINYILALAIYLIIISTYLKAINLTYLTIFIVIFITFTFFILAFLLSYYKTSKYLRNIEKTMDKLPEKYLITEILQKPRSAEKLAYYRILKRANKSMLENVTDIKEKQKDYKEYIESWVHEIKIPITSAKLLCENNKSDITNKIGGAGAVDPRSRRGRSGGALRQHDPVGRHGAGRRSYGEPSCPHRRIHAGTESRRGHRLRRNGGGRGRMRPCGQGRRRCQPL